MAIWKPQQLLQASSEEVPQAGPQVLQASAQVLQASSDLLQAGSDLLQTGSDLLQTGSEEVQWCRQRWHEGRRRSGSSAGKRKCSQTRQESLSRFAARTALTMKCSAETYHAWRNDRRKPVASERRACCVPGVSRRGARPVPSGVTAKPHC